MKTINEYLINRQTREISGSQYTLDQFLSELKKIGLQTDAPHNSFIDPGDLLYIHPSNRLQRFPFVKFIYNIYRYDRRPTDVLIINNIENGIDMRVNSSTTHRHSNIDFTKYNVITDLDKGRRIYMLDDKLIELFKILFKNFI